MSAEDGVPTQRRVKTWIEKIRKGQVALPRFQRGIEWKDSNVIDLLTALIECRPVGVLLILELNPQERPLPFDPHCLRDAPELDVDKCTELVLDGQQRLTALWRALNNTFYDNSSSDRSRRTFFIEVMIVEEDNGDKRLKMKEIRRYKHSVSGEKKVIENPVLAWEKNLIPVHHLGINTTASVKAMQHWCDAACRQNASESRDLEDHIRSLAETLLDRDISFYSLSPDTPQGTAIDVFIKSNESSVKISRFDIAVATIESEFQEPLREKIENIEIDNDRLNRFFGSNEDSRISNLGELVLKVACLMCEKPLVPASRNYTKSEVISTVVEKWSHITEAIDWTFDFIEKERIWDSQRLPSVVPLRVIPALYQHRPSDPDKIGQFNREIRKYLWLSFVTSRYDQSAETHLHEDYKEYFSEKRPPIFRCSVPSADDLVDLENPLASPKTASSLSRAILAISFRRGARDLASDEQITKDDIQKRQYHHLFPKALLEGEGRKSPEINHALNYALISDKTNNKMKADPPIRYLRKRLNLSSGIDEDTVRSRVESHVIPFDELNVEDGKDERYEDFLRARAGLISRAMEQLCRGNDW